MRHKSWKMTCIVYVIIWVWMILALVVLGKKQEEPMEAANPREVTNIDSDELTDVMWNYPKKIRLGEQYLNLAFDSEEQKKVTLKEQQGRYTMLTYWASWCDYCEEQMKVLKMAGTVLEEEGVDCILVDKLDGEKETVEQAMDYLKQKQISLPVVFDRNLKVYDKLGICIVPTTLFLNPEGELVYCQAGVIESLEQLKSILAYIKQGPEADLVHYIQGTLMGEDGGVHTNAVKKEGDPPRGYDVLSESQGLMMLYAAKTGNQELFDQAFSYVKSELYRKNLAVWYSSKGKQADANALLDDLRILKALNEMGETDPAYRSEAKKLAQAIVSYNVKDGHAVDFYDFSSKAAGNRFTLCYGDFQALDLLNGEQGAEDISGHALQIVEGGYISDTFPFYYNYYDYKKKEYDQGSINMAEGMYTLYHLAAIGQLREESVAWLKEKLNGNGIWARYDVYGDVVNGFEYQSPAIYALVGLIAVEIDDEELLTMAVSRMEDDRCFDITKDINGAFGKEASKIMSYDQCMPLVLYGNMREKREAKRTLE